MQLFHYHLVTKRVRELEARYLGKLGFALVARHGFLGDDVTVSEPGISWNELDEAGFDLRLTEVELGAVDVVVQPGQWDMPRVDHLGLALDDDQFAAAVERAEEAGFAVRPQHGPWTFVGTDAGYRLELHPPHAWIDEVLSRSGQLRVAELHVKTDDPEGGADALALVLGCTRTGTDVTVGDAVVRFLGGGPHGRPELHAEGFLGEASVDDGS